MIVSNLQGGLGNQMLQYATGLRFAHLFNSSLTLDTYLLDTQAKKKNLTTRKLELNHFNINASVRYLDQKVLFKYPLSWKEKFFYFKKQISGRSSFLLFNEENIHLLNKSVSNQPIYLKGFWQSEEYFTDIRDVLLQHFTPRYSFDEINEKLIRQIGSVNSVSIHIRRGDYITNPRYASRYENLSLDYYKKGISYILRHQEIDHIYVFTDDPQWARENIPQVTQSLSYSIVDKNTGTDGYKDMILMSHCKHNIIANSTFSWWGAWLNQYEDKIVIAPQKWFSDPELNKSQNIVPDRWVKL